MTKSGNEHWFNTVKTQDEIISISDSIQKDGFYCLEDAISQSFLKQLETSVNELINIHGKRYFSVILPGRGNEEFNQPFKEIYKDEDFNTLLNQLANTFSNQIVSRSNSFNILRVVTGEKTDEQSLKFHYDSTLITALVPIFIPSGQQNESGHFIAFTNSRSIRSSALINIIEKFLIQNKLSQRVLPHFLLKNQRKKIIELKPGNIYFFSGLQTLHANYPVNKEYVRATLLCFHGDPYPDSNILKYVRKKRHNEENKNIEI